MQWAALSLSSSTKPHTHPVVRDNVVVNVCLWVPGFGTVLCKRFPLFASLCLPPSPLLLLLVPNPLRSAPAVGAGKKGSYWAGHPPLLLLLLLLLPLHTTPKPVVTQAIALGLELLSTVTPAHVVLQVDVASPPSLAPVNAPAVGVLPASAPKVGVRLLARVSSSCQWSCGE